MTFEIMKEIEVLSESSNGWQKLLAVVKWGENAPKLDIRTWSLDRTKCSRGITLTSEEFRLLGLVDTEKYADYLDSLGD